VYKVFREDRHKELGTLPVREFDCISKSLRDEKLLPDNQVARLPVSLLLDTFSICSFDSSAMLDGRDLIKLLSDRSKPVRDDNFPKLEGMEPVK
jgi:hypothetical protein